MDRPSSYRSARLFAGVATILLVSVSLLPQGAADLEDVLILAEDRTRSTEWNLSNITSNQTHVIYQIAAFVANGTFNESFTVDTKWAPARNYSTLISVVVEALGSEETIELVTPSGGRLATVPRAIYHNDTIAGYAGIFYDVVPVPGVYAVVDQAMGGPLARFQLHVTASSPVPDQTGEERSEPAEARLPGCKEGKAPELLVARVPPAYKSRSSDPLNAAAMTVATVSPAWISEKADPFYPICSVVADVVHPHAGVMALGVTGPTHVPSTGRGCVPVGGTYRALLLTSGLDDRRVSHHDGRTSRHYTEVRVSDRSLQVTSADRSDTHPSGQQLLTTWAASDMAASASKPTSDTFADIVDGLSAFARSPPLSLTLMAFAKVLRAMAKVDEGTSATADHKLARYAEIRFTRPCSGLSIVEVSAEAAFTWRESLTVADGRGNVWKSEMTGGTARVRSLLEITVCHESDPRLCDGR